MTSVRFSARAEVDLDELYLGSFQRFGEAQTEAYFQALRDAFQRIVEMPRIGQGVASAASSARRLVCRSHHIFYEETPDGVLILRVLHASRDPSAWPEDE